MTSSPQRGRLPAARRDRRPTLAALALLLVLLGALGSALVAYRSGDRVNVLVASRDLPFGAVVSETDFQEIRTAADTPGVILASRREEFVGLHTTGAIPAGSVLHPKMFSVADLVPSDGALVGLMLDAQRRPEPVPSPGQVVRIYYVSGQTGRGGSGFSPGEPVVEAARVMSVGPGPTADSTSLTVLVADDVAGDVANFNSSGNLAVSLLPDQTSPTIDTVRE